MSQTQFNPTEMIFHKYLANHQVCFLVTDESYRVEQAIKAAAKRLNTERYADDKKASSRVSVMVHDKYCGFYEGLPTLSQPTDKTDLPLVALQVMLDDMAGINKTNSQIKKLAFEPADNIIFVLKDWEGALLGNPVVVQALRNMIQSNMGSKERFMTDDGHGRATRGKRMLVFVTTNERIPNTLPELKSFTVPLPNDTILGEVVDNVFEPLAELHKETKGKEGLKAPDKPTRQTLITAMQGSTYQFAEDTLTLTLARHRNLDNMDDVLRTIEREKAAYIAGVPGLVYIPTHGITNAAQLPGYEAAVKFLLDRKGIDPDEARKRSIQPLKGMTLAGAPGVGKTMFGKATASLMGRILLLWNLGESQGSLVGDSEANTRRAIQIAQAMHAVILLDDVDKAGVKAASGASETAIEGGPFGRMIQMLLTEMSSENNNAIWIFTCNRINNLPPELIRPGRMDERFFVQRPDSETRERILRTHIEKRLWPIGDEKMIGLLSDDTTTQGWTGAELEDLVAKASIHALTNGRKELDYRWMMQQGKVTTPMIKQGAYAKDIQDMEGFCDTWTKIGRIDRKVATDVKGRSSRSTEV